jgi:peptidoglycan hydrolase CwlO-like protein
MVTIKETIPEDFETDKCDITEDGRKIGEFEIEIGTETTGDNQLKMPENPEQYISVIKANVEHNCSKIMEFMSKLLAEEVSKKVEEHKIEIDELKSKISEQNDEIEHLEIVIGDKEDEFTEKLKLQALSHEVSHFDIKM